MNGFWKGILVGLVATSLLHAAVQLLRPHLNKPLVHSVAVTGPEESDVISTHTDGESDISNEESEGTGEKSTDEESPSTAEVLKEKVRVLCFVMTMSKNQKKADTVSNTWGKRCNKLVFFIATTDKIPKRTENTYIKVRVEGGDRGSMSNMPKLRASILYLYKHFYKDYDWFFKADEDTYTIVENLRYFLSDKDPNDPGYYGQKFDKIVKQGYNSGGAGYVLSKETVRRFATRYRSHRKQCVKTRGPEDFEISGCFERLGIAPSADTRDSYGRTRFHALDVHAHMQANYPDWYKDYDKVGGTIYGPHGISDYAITFHFVSAAQMRELEFYVYHLRPYGVINHNEDINKPPKVKRNILDLKKLEKTDHIL